MTALLDSDVLICAQGGEYKSEVARQTILAGGVISVQVLNEFAAVPPVAIFLENRELK